VLAAVAARLGRGAATEGCSAETLSRAAWDPAIVAGQVLREARASLWLRCGGARSQHARTRSSFNPLLGPVIFLAIMSTVFAAVFLVADPVTGFLDGVVDSARAGLSHRLGTGC